MRRTTTRIRALSSSTWRTSSPRRGRARKRTNRSRRRTKWKKSMTRTTKTKTTTNSSTTPTRSTLLSEGRDQARDADLEAVELVDTLLIRADVLVSDLCIGSLLSTQSTLTSLRGLHMRRPTQRQASPFSRANQATLALTALSLQHTLFNATIDTLLPRVCAVISCEANHAMQSAVQSRPSNPKNLASRNLLRLPSSPSSQNSRNRNRRSLLSSQNSNQRSLQSSRNRNRRSPLSSRKRNLKSPPDNRSRPNSPNSQRRSQTLKANNQKARNSPKMMSL